MLHSVGATFEQWFGEQQLQELQRIISATGAQIVLSTAWRLAKASLERVASELSGAGMPVPISSTPNLQPGDVKGRAVEITAWLQKHVHLVHEGRWLAIDDIPLYPDLPAMNVVKTGCFTGLTPQLADEAIEKLLCRELN